MEILIDVHESFDEKSWLSTPLSCGDIWIKEESLLPNNPLIIERKTWDDVYTSWGSKRIEDQISRILKETDNGILLIEGKLNQSWIWRNKKNYSQNCWIEEILE